MLWSALVLIVFWYFISTNSLAITVTGVAVVGVGWVAVAGSATTQAGVVVGLVWLLLIGGALNATGIPRSDPDSDVAKLTRDTLLVPRIAWHAAFTTLALGCLWVGGGALLGLR